MPTRHQQPPACSASMSLRRIAPALVALTVGCAGPDDKSAPGPSAGTGGIGGAGTSGAGSAGTAGGNTAGTGGAGGVAGSGSAAGSAPAGARPPARPAGATPTGGATRAFLARRYYFGAVDPATNQTDPQAWRRIGYDFDGVTTTPALAASDSPGTCHRPDGSLPTSLIDGDDGRDNNFGSELLRLTGSLSSGPDALEHDVNSAYPAVPRQTLVLLIDDLADGADDSEVRVGIMYTASKGVTSPKWDGTDHFFIDDRSVVPGTAQPRLVFSHGYLTGHHLVSGDFGQPLEGPFFFPLPDQGLAPLGVRTMTLALDLDPTHKQVLGATMAGVLPLADLVKLIMPAAVNAGIQCGPKGEDFVLGLVRPVADLSADLPGFLDPTGASECDAVSYGWRIEWSPVAVPTLADLVTEPAVDDPCTKSATP